MSRVRALVALLAVALAVALIPMPPAAQAARATVGVPSQPCRGMTKAQCTAAIEGTRLSREEARCFIGAGVGLFGGVVGGVIGAATARGLVGAAIGGSAAGCLGRMLP